MSGLPRSAAQGSEICPEGPEQQSGGPGLVALGLFPTPAERGQLGAQGSGSQSEGAAARRWGQQDGHQGTATCLVLSF